ncbi:uncharacterized protein LOC118749058 [Rhagoletis pomonella]|uniref:uncharacterized protein LOC118749058 n=2 Tax=Rhagoletis pomonella TaxID=28610 RepID=UPI0017855291|nr:uncharacterized protein LOC118749058 [Rhagoletis pomonella]
MMEDSEEIIEATEYLFESDMMTTSTPKELREPKGALRKKFKLSVDYNKQFSEASTSLPSQTCRTSNDDIMQVLELILQKQNDFEARMDRLEERIPEKHEVMAQHKVMRESKVLIKRVHKLVCRISGEAENDMHTEFASLMPFTTIESIFDMEEKLKAAEYEEAMKTYLFTLKGTSGDIGPVMKKVFCDEVIYKFNWDGRCGKKALRKLKLVHDVLFDTFIIKGRIDFEREIKKFVEQSHNRFKQRRYLDKKQQGNNFQIKHLSITN